MDQQALQELINKFLSGTATPAEQQLLSDWFQHQAGGEALWEIDHPHEREALKAELFSAVSQATGIGSSAAPVIAARRTWFGYAAAAAVLIILAGASWFLLSRKPQEKAATVADHMIQPGGGKATLTLADGSRIELDNAANGELVQQGDARIVKLANGQIAYNLKGAGERQALMNTMQTPRGGKYQLVLPDGTKAWLNAASSITYPAAFTGVSRPVTITGEVYFEVAKDRSKPFIVNVDGKAQVEVLGTHFNINSYADEDAIRTTLLEGAIRLTQNAQRKTLKPGEQGIASIHSPLTIDDSPDLTQVMAWKNGMFNFDHADIQTVMRKIARWYNVEVVYEGDISNTWLMGKLPMNTSIDRVLGILGKIGVRFRIEGKKIIVTK